MRHLLAAAVSLTLIASTVAQTPAVPLIERAKLFGNPSRTGGQDQP